jgi:hypothetical protein
MEVPSTLVFRGPPLHARRLWEYFEGHFHSVPVLPRARGLLTSVGPDQRKILPMLLPDLPRGTAGSESHRRAQPDILMRSQRLLSNQALAHVS